MKRLLILFVSFAFIGCTTFDEVRYIGDAYYPDNSYFEILGGFGTTFRTINETDKIIAIYEENFNNIKTVRTTDKVLFRFADGKELVLSYNNRVSQYEGGDYFYLRATSGAIEDFGTLEIIRYNTDDGYYNREVDKGQAEKLITRFNGIKSAATAKYGNKETTE